MRFRITSRRHGRKGLTTDNYYYSPCGKTFRTHKQVCPNQAGLLWSSSWLCNWLWLMSPAVDYKTPIYLWCGVQVAEFLGLQPAPKQQQQEQLLQNELPESFNILSVTVLDSGCSPSSSAASSEDLSGKRAHSAMTSTDTAQNCNRTGQLHAQQQHAVSAPAALGSSMSQGVSSVSEGSQLPSAKRTKAALAAKYTGSCSGSGVLSAPAAAAFSLPSTFSTATEADSCITGAESERACRAAPAMQQHASQLLMSAPAQPAASSTACSKPSSSEVAVSSRLFVKPAAVQEPQRRRQAVQQVPKWKPRQPAAWRAKLRELANQAAAEQGLLS